MPKVLVGKLEGMRLLGKPRHRWEDNTKMNLKGSGLNSFGLGQSATITVEHVFLITNLHILGKL
jgi:hypothetical protein